MAKNFRLKLVISSLLTLLPMLAGLLLWNNVPELLTSHWGFDGQANGWIGRGMAVFGMPLTMLAVHWLCLFGTLKLDPKNKGMDGKALELTFWLIPVVSNFASAVIYSTAFGKDWDLSFFTLIFMGILFIVIGNYLPKCRQNYTMGIKVPWTLNNEENWNATHRFAGRVWVIGGLLMMLAAFLPEKHLPAVMVVLILVLALVPTLYSYLYYRKQLAAGTADRSDASFIPKGVNRKAACVSLVIAVVILVGAVALLFTGNIALSYGEDSFTIEADYWGDLTVSYDAVESIEFDDNNDAGIRVNGFGTPRLSMGMFENEEYGTYTRYAYTRCPCAVVLDVEGKTLMISGADEAATRQIYDELTARLG